MSWCSSSWCTDYSECVLLTLVSTHSDDTLLLGAALKALGDAASSHLASFSASLT